MTSKLSLSDWSFFGWMALANSAISESVKPLPPFTGIFFSFSLRFARFPAIISGADIALDSRDASAAFFLAAIVAALFKDAKKSPSSSSSTNGFSSI